MNELLATISDLYSSPVPFTLKGEVEKGVLSINKVITNGTDTYFLKQYRTELSEDKIKEVHAIKKYFYDSGIPVILPIKNKEGKTYFIFSNSLYALFPYVEGKHIDRHQELTPSVLIELGTMLGKIHKTGFECLFKIHDTFNDWNPERFAGYFNDIIKILENKSNKSEFDIKAYDLLMLKKSLIQQNTKKLSDFHISSQLIHGDYHEQNVFFDKDNKILRVFDLEKAEYAPRAYELARSLDYVCLSEQYNKKESIEKAKIYVQAYNSIFPITGGGLREGIEIWYLKLIHSAWIEKEHFLNNNFRADIFFENNIKEIHYLKDHRKELVNELAESLK